MADLMNEANFLRFYHTSEDAVKDKDFLKNQAFSKTSNTVSGLMFVPLAMQFWQLSLCNHEASVSMYKRVRIFKMATFLGALAAGSYEYVKLRKQWQYYDRFYPEPTELQKTLYREAMMFKENKFVATSIEEKLAKVEDPDVQQLYSAMYQLPPQRDAAADENVNSPSHKEHHG
jgi:hypothetical protein